MSRLISLIEEVIKDCNIRVATSPGRAQNPGKERVRTAITTVPDTLKRLVVVPWRGPEGPARIPARSATE